jgi:co-chaperonin GroES (HSP10)
MQPKLVRMQHGEYVAGEWVGTNLSGISPHGDRVLVLPDLFSPTFAGGKLDHTPDVIERHNLASQTGVLIALGDDAWAWNSDRSRRYEGAKPQAGQRVIFEQYAGTSLWGADGNRYRLMDDKCIGGLFVGNIPVVAKQKPTPSIARVTRAPLIAARA